MNKELLENKVVRLCHELTDRPGCMALVVCIEPREKEDGSFGSQFCAHAEVSEGVTAEGRAVLERMYNAMMVQWNAEEKQGQTEVCGCDGKETEGPYEVIEGADDPDCMFFYIVNNNVETYIGLPEEVARFVYGTGYTPDKETARKRATVYCRLLNALYRENQVCGCDGKEQEELGF